MTTTSTAKERNIRTASLTVHRGFPTTRAQYGWEAKCGAGKRVGWTNTRYTATAQPITCPKCIAQADSDARHG